LSSVGSFHFHWPEYFIEAAALGIFMISAGVFTALVENPGSWFCRAIASAELRRGLIGLAMGSTAAGLIYSPWGRRSGAHMNPAVTLTFLRLGKIPFGDAAFYILFQLVGGLAGVLITALFLRSAFTAPPTHFVVTVPGPGGNLEAFSGELVIASLMMTMILLVSNAPAIARFTGLFSGILICGFVTFEAPLSGFGMNPARTFASALPSGTWTAFWIYLVAPPLGMLLAAEAALRLRGAASIRCCKLHHRSARPCIFCGQPNQPTGPATATA
jgi:aquaporin Z